MIALLRGELVARGEDHVVVLCGGVGYKALVSSQTLREAPGTGELITLHTQLIAREDALSLYGFASELERDLFLSLLAVQAVGPKVALALLSGCGPEELISALAAGDAARLQAAPGIGKRTAERIIVELREKVTALAAPVSPGSSISARRGPGREASARLLARDGLLELGYTQAEAEQLLAHADGESAEELIGQALRLARTP